MKLRIVTALASLTLCLSSTIPVFAADGNDGFLSDLLELPVQTTALGTGLAVGIPVSIAKSIPSSINEAADLIAPHRDHKPLSTLTIAVPAIPIGTVSGVAQGIAHGFNNAVNNCQENPFSLESMSLQSAADQ